MHLTLRSPRVDLAIEGLTALVGGAGDGRRRAISSLWRLARRLSWDLAGALDGVPDEIGAPERAGEGAPSAEIRSSAGPARLTHPALDARLARAGAPMTDALARWPVGSELDATGELAFSFERSELALGLEGEAVLDDGDARLSLDAAELADGCVHRASLRLRPATRTIFAELSENRGRGRLSGRLMLGSVPGSGARVEAPAWAPALTRVLEELVRWIAGTVAVLPQDRRALASLYKRLVGAASLLAPEELAFASLLRGAEAVGSDDRGVLPAELTHALARGTVGGHVGFRRAPEGPPITWSPADGVQLPLHEAPPQVAALAPLDLYLRHLAAPGDLLLFEEPDLALDDARRDELFGVLAHLASAGIRVVVSAARTDVGRDLAAAGARAGVTTAVHPFT